MPARVSIPQTGIELIVGEPGAGKSYFAVHRMLDAVVHLRRPCWTNLPLRWPVVRKYLRTRGGENLAKLVRPMTRPHFEAFLKRFRHRQAWTAQMRTERGYSRRQAAAAWLDFAGPDVWEGPDANWIAFGAIVCIDEVHDWCPNAAIRVGERESDDLLPWLTMHRHGTYWVWAITQALRQVSQNWRSLATEVHHVTNAGMRPLAWGLTPQLFGVRCLLRSSYSREAWNDGVPQLEPHHRELFFPSMPWRRWVFRLYDSFSHVASRSEIADSVESVRIAAGLDGKAEEVMPPTRVGGWGGKIVAVVAMVGIGGAAYLYGGSRTKSEPSDAKAVLPATVSTVRGMVGDQALGAEGKVWRVGDSIDGREVTAVMATKRTLFARDADGVHWLYAVGREPRKLGTDEEVRRTAELTRAAIVRSRAVASSPSP